jgi:hypothetical protein
MTELRVGDLVVRQTQTERKTFSTMKTAAPLTKLGRTYTVHRTDRGPETHIAVTGLIDARDHLPDKNTLCIEIITDQLFDPRPLIEVAIDTSPHLLIKVRTREQILASVDVRTTDAMLARDGREVLDTGLDLLSTCIGATARGAGHDHVAANRHRQYREVETGANNRVRAQSIRDQIRLSLLAKEYIVRRSES